MISILVPTRKRPAMFARFVNSVLTTADNPDQIEFIASISDDDSSYDGEHYPPQVKITRGPRKILSLCYEWEKGEGPIYFLGGDDLIFHTKGWDTKVLATFDQYPDKIVLVHGDDGDPNKDKTNATHSFIHRQWIDVLGRYLPPYFSGDFTDTWLSDIANGVGRRVKIDIYTEHVHPAFGKREQDDTDKEKWKKHFEDNMPQKYIDTLPERLADIEKLKSYLDIFHSL